MAYCDPNIVKSPRKYVSNLSIIYDGGEVSWSLSKMLWNEDPAMGIRWNGNEESPLGILQSRGIPT